MTRRTFVQATSTTLALSGVPLIQAGCRAEPSPEQESASPAASTRQPVVFVSHGAPNLALDEAKGADLRRMADGMPRPSAILMLSAHWERTPVTVGTIEPRELIHDYSGFDPALGDLRHDAPLAPELARRVAHLLDVEFDPRPRGWDHGVWVPLIHMDPEARTPLLQLSLPTRLSAAELLALGERLRPLRDEGVLVMGSGGLVHNLGQLDWAESRPTPTWATDFEEWTRERLVAHDRDALADIIDGAPALREAHPTLEHLQPLLVAAGASQEKDAVTFPVGGFEYSSLSRTAVRFG